MNYPSLKPCPFCGDNPRITAFYGYDDGDIYILENSSEGEFIHHDWRAIRKRPSDDEGWFTNAGVTCECGMKCMWEIPIEPVRYKDWSEQGEVLVNDLCRKIAERWNLRMGVPREMCANCKHHVLTSEFGVVKCALESRNKIYTYNCSCDKWEGED